jgi:hypothetical protein
LILILILILIGNGVVGGVGRALLGWVARVDVRVVGRASSWRGRLVRRLVPVAGAALSFLVVGI